MTMRTRIGRRIDAQRVAQLVSMPGIDPRVWVSLCIVDKVVVDKDFGVFADVHIMSTATVGEDGSVVAQRETVRVAPDYAGNGFGLYMPRPQEGDEVLVTWPDGNPDHGGVLVKRLWSAADLPPAGASDNPDDFLLLIEKDRNLRMQVQGQGNLVLIADQGKVLLGAESGTLPVARKNDHSNDGKFVFAFTPGTGLAALSIVYTDPDGHVTTLASGSGTVNVVGKISEGSGKTESA